MAQLPDDLIYQGVSIDISFGQAQPMFGDIFLICGDNHPGFPPSGKFEFQSLADLNFEQVDDYFGVRSTNDEGNDVRVWLYPLVDEEAVYHHPGPFDGIRLDYSILRNPAITSDFFLKAIERFSKFGSRVYYRNRERDLGLPPKVQTVRSDIDAVITHWSDQGIVVGSNDALEIDF